MNFITKKAQKFRNTQLNNLNETSPVESNYYSIETPIKTESDKKTKKKYALKKNNFICLPIHCCKKVFSRI